MFEEVSSKIVATINLKENIWLQILWHHFETFQIVPDRFFIVLF